MAVIWVAPADRLDAILSRHAPSHVVLIASPDAVDRKPQPPHAEVAGIAGPRSTHRRAASFETQAWPAPQDEEVGCCGITEHLQFHDIDAPRPGLVAPSTADVERLLAVARSWDGTRPLAVACALGISRSPAAAFAIACAARPGIAEVEIAARLRAASPCATPNRLLVALADAALGREGRMIAAVAALGRGIDYVPQAGFALGLPPIGA